MALTATLQAPTLPQRIQCRVGPSGEGVCFPHARHSSFHGTKLTRSPLRCSQQGSRQCRGSVRAAATAEGNSAPKTKKTTRIHKLVEENGVLLMPGCYDALSARILQKSGFNAGMQPALS